LLTLKHLWLQRDEIQPLSLGRLASGTGRTDDG